jgi:hypothetical protein
MLESEVSGMAPPSFSGMLDLDAFPLTAAGKSAARRVLVVLHEQTAPQYCPLLACLVPILLLYLSEAHCYTAIQTMLKRQRQQNAEASHDYFLRSKAEDLTFLRTFMELLWVKQYQAWKMAQRMQKLGVIAAPLKATAAKVAGELSAGLDFTAQQQEVHWLGHFQSFFLGLLPMHNVLRLVDCFLSEGRKVGCYS